MMTYLWMGVLLSLIFGLFYRKQVMAAWREDNDAVRFSVLGSVFLVILAWPLVVFHFAAKTYVDNLE